MVDDRAAVATDAAVGDRGDLGGEFGDQLCVVAPVEQVSGPKHRQIGVDRLLPEERIEIVWHVCGFDAKDAGDGPGVDAIDYRGGSAAALRAARRESGSGRDSGAKRARARESGARHAGSSRPAHSVDCPSSKAMHDSGGNGAPK